MTQGSRWRRHFIILERPKAWSDVGRDGTAGARGWQGSVGAAGPAGIVDGYEGLMFGAEGVWTPSGTLWRIGCIWGMRATMGGKSPILALSPWGIGWRT